MTDFTWKPLNTKSLDYILNSDAFLNIAVGAIRSGKTVIATATFMSHILSSPHDKFIMAGNTLNSLKRNVIDLFTDMLSSEGIQYDLRIGSQELQVEDKHIALFGLDKEGADKKIRGYTSAGALVDEITTMPQSAFEMLLSRNSLQGSRVFCTCNPVSPLNYVYTNYVQNKEAIKQGYIKVWNFQLKDNLTLTGEYIQTLKNIYPPNSVFYKRNIRGEWVTGQGLIFDKFTDENIIHLDDPAQFIHACDHVEIGSDYGTSTTSCYSVIGVQEFDDYTSYTLISEDGFDAKQKGYTQTDTERVQDIYELQEKYQLGADSTFWVSHDAGSLKTALIRDMRIKMQIKTFKPDTIECIQTMSSLFYNNYLFINDTCTETIKQIYGYEWDTKKAEKGIDAPVKQNDHYIDSMRAPIMHHLYEPVQEFSELVYI